MIQLPCSNSELVDKIIILETKVANGVFAAQQELEKLLEIYGQQSWSSSPIIDAYKRMLKTIHEIMWMAEDKKRDYDNSGQFDDEYVAWTRITHIINDERARIKKNIDKYSGSSIMEYKSYLEAEE